MLAEIPAKLFMEWQEYFKRRPFGEAAADVRVGILDSIVANLFRKRGQRKATPMDFVLGERPRRRQTANEMMRNMQQFAMAHNAAVSQRTRG